MVKNRLDYKEANPDIMKTMSVLEKTVSNSTIPESLRELIQLRVSQVNGCPYCVDMHGKNAIKAGETDRRLLSLTVWKTTSLFNQKEKSALAWADALTSLPKDGVPDNIYNDVCAHFNEKEIIELTFIITTINTWNRFGIGFQLKPK